MLGQGKSGAFLPPKGWRILPHDAATRQDLEEHLALAMQYEGPNLTILGAALSDPQHKGLVAEAVVNIVKDQPMDDWRRRLWFLYEWMTGEMLEELQDAPESVPYVDILDETQYYTSSPVPSARHRVRDNLLGTNHFSPTVRRTAALKAYAMKDYGKRAKQLLAMNGNALTRNYSYDMVVQESVHSMFIENVTYEDYDVPRLASTLMQHGNFDDLPLTAESLKQYFVPLVMGSSDIPNSNTKYRDQQSYVSETVCTVDDTKDQILYVPAKPDDIESLMQGMFQTLDRVLTDREKHPEAVDCVVQAAAFGFGLVYVQPFNDGNGRLHRMMIQQLLGRLGFVPKMMFPVSRVMVHQKDIYEQALQQFDEHSMPFIQYHLDGDGRMSVTNNTAHLYRYFDATPMAEYLYYCVAQCVETDLPNYCNLVSQTYYRAYE